MMSETTDMTDSVNSLLQLFAIVRLLFKSAVDG